MSLPPDSSQPDPDPSVAPQASPDAPAARSAAASPLRKLAVELGPLLVFFAVQRAVDIFWATGAFMLATLVSVLVARRSEGRWPAMPLITGVFVLVFGGLTLALQDGQFIKIKPTIVNLLFAAILLGGLFRGRLFLKLVFGEAFLLDEAGWRLLTVRFGLYFVCLAALNEVVWRNASEDTWVSFKVFGILPLTVLFMLSQSALIQRHKLEA